MTLKEFSRKLESLINNAVDTALMNKIGKTASESIKTRTRRGFGVSQDGGKATKLKGISESYKKQRRRLRKKGQLSGDTSPAKSNLTQTGKMVDNVTFKSSNNETTIFISGRENESKAQQQEKAGRIFMNLSKRDLQEIEEIIDQQIQMDINKKGL